MAKGAPVADITRANFQTTLGLLADAIAAETWGAARKLYAQAEVIAAGLPHDQSDGGTTERMRQSLKDLKTAIDEAEAGVARDGQPAITLVDLSGLRT